MTNKIKPPKPEPVKHIEYKSDMIDYIGDLILWIMGIFTFVYGLWIIYEILVILVR